MKSLVSLNNIGVSIIIILLFVGCNRFYGSNSSETLPGNLNVTCKQYLQEFEKYWEKRDGYYKVLGTSPSSYVELYENTNVCFQGLSVKLLKKYLGEPNIETSTELTYYVAEPCTKGNLYCNIQVFKIENDSFKETLRVAPKRHNEGWI